MSDQSASYRNWIVRLGVIAAIVAAVVVGLRLSLKSDVLRSQVVRSIEQSVADMTGARLEIGSVRGDLYKGIRFENVYLIAADTLLSADTVRIEYSIWPLLRKSILIEMLVVDGLSVHIEQDSAGTFNYETLIPQSEDPQEPGAVWSVVVSDIYLNGGAVTYQDMTAASADDIRLSDISASGSFRMLESSWQAHVRSLNLEVNHRALDGNLGLQLSAMADDDAVSINNVLLRYGESFAAVAGRYLVSGDSLDAHIEIEPLASVDVNTYIDPQLVQNLDLDISLKGSNRNLEVLAHVRDGSRDVLTIAAMVDERESVYGLSAVSIHSPGFRIGDYMDIEDLAGVTFDDGEAVFAGWMPFVDPSSIVGDSKVQISNFEYQSYRFGEIESNITKRNGQTTAEMNIRTGNNRMGGRVTLSDLVSDRSNWSATLVADIPNLRQLDLSQTVPISFKSQIDANGTGFVLGEMISNFGGVLTDIKVDGQKVDKVEFEGSIRDQLLIHSMVATIGNGTLSASGSSTLDIDLPVYEFKVSAQRFDLSKIVGLEELSTDLNADLVVSGIGIDTSKRTMTLALNADSSWINQTKIDRVEANIALAGNRMFIEHASLTSDIADGQFSGDFDIDDVFRPSNNMVFNLDLKNLQPLASFVGVEYLQAKGEIRGRVEEGAIAPELVAIIALDDVAYDSITVRRVVGQYVMSVQNSPSYQAELDVLSPVFNGTELEDMRFTSRGTISGRDYRGQFGFELNAQTESGISISGNYGLESDTLRLSTSSFDIRGPARTYRQDRRFNMTYASGVFRSDTLVLRAEPDAQLLLQVRYQSADSTSLWLDAANVNLEALQAGLMTQPIIAGYMTGSASIAYAEDNLSIQTDVNFTEFSWQELMIDTITVEAVIDHQKLVGNFLAKDEGKILLNAIFDLPFRLGDPIAFEDQFFEQLADAEITVDSLDLSEYTDVLIQLGLPQLTGVLNASTKLSGEAGNPMLAGGVSLQDGTIGGIPAERIVLGWEYNHALKQLSCTAIMDAAGQQVFNSSFNLPFNLDLRNFSQLVPESSDPVDGRLDAEGFNLALVSQFLPPEYADQLVGTIDGRIDLRGTIGQPNFDGSLRLRNAGIHILPGNVTLRNISADFIFNRDRVEFESLAVRSGAGDFLAGGYIQLDGFGPGKVAVDMRARQFNISDTRDARMVVSFDGTLSGTIQRPDLTGSMIVNSANVFLDNFGERTVEDVQLEGEEPIEAPSIYDSLSIRMRVQVDPNVWMRNRTSPELAIELQGDMDVLKDRGSDLMAFGSLGTRQGYAMQYGKRFQLKRGQLTFSGDPTNPALDIVSLYELKVPEDIEIRYLIGGTVDEPIFDFASNPEMELENIISYTLFGKPFGALFNWQQSFSGGGGGSALARDAAIGVLVDRVESLATESLGIDLLQIDSNRQGEMVTTSVKAGKYITDKLFVAVLNELGGSDAVTRVVLEYYIRRNLLLMVTQGNDRRSGVDILWKYEY